jgi:hypothetical protein
VGLNLQHASVVINMDWPWNPAVLEQRIGRVHRLGQSRETVEKASANIPAQVTEEAEDAAGVPTAEPPEALSADVAAVETAAPDAIRAGVMGENPWGGFLRSGIAFLAELAAAARGSSTPGRPASTGLPLVRRDPKSGEAYLHLPVPKPEVIERFLAAAQELLGQAGN